MSKTIRRSVRSARSSFAGESGMSIVQVMAGIILTAIIAAAGVFSTLAVIDWGQDNAAKTALEDVRTAQEVYLTQTASDDNGGGYATNSKALVDAKLLDSAGTVGTAGSTGPTADYAAVSVSKTGKVFYIEKHDGPVEEAANVDGVTEGLAAQAADDIKPAA